MISSKNYTETNFTEEFLNSKNIPFKVIKVNPKASPWGVARYNKIPYQKLIRAKLIKNYGNNFLVCVSIDRIIDYKHLCNNITKDLVTIRGSQSNKKFYEPGVDSYVPIPEIFNAIGIIDSSCQVDGNVYFFSESPGKLIEIDAKDFLVLHSDSKVLDISYPLSKLKLYQEPPGFKDANVIKGKFSGTRMKSRIIETFEIPALHYVVDEIADLKSKKSIDVTKLVELVSSEPSIASQVMRWACSPYYKNKGNANSLEEAIIKVLGPELTINIAIGLSIGKSLQVPEEGYIGIKNFWYEALVTANMLDELVKFVPEEKEIKKGYLYLSGLLHDIGYLVLGQVFLPQFEILSQTLELNRDVGEVKLENHLFQVNHQQIASWLLKSWHFPREIVTAVEFHHHDDYFGKDAIYPNLVFIADTLLKKHFYKNRRSGKEIPKEMYEYVGITEEQAFKALESIKCKQSKIVNLGKDIFSIEDDSYKKKMKL